MVYMVHLYRPDLHPSFVKLIRDLTLRSLWCCYTVVGTSCILLIRIPRFYMILQHQLVWHHRPVRMFLSEQHLYLCCSSLWAVEDFNSGHVNHRVSLTVLHGFVDQRAGEAFLKADRGRQFMHSHIKVELPFHARIFKRLETWRHSCKKYKQDNMSATTPHVKVRYQSPSSAPSSERTRPRRREQQPSTSTACCAISTRSSSHWDCGHSARLEGEKKTSKWVLCPQAGDRNNNTG